MRDYLDVIDLDYKKHSDDTTTDGEISYCNCGYPYFSSLRTGLNSENEAVEYWAPVTCLVNDNGNDLDRCPECGADLFE